MNIKQTNIPFPDKELSDDEKIDMAFDLKSKAGDLKKAFINKAAEEYDQIVQYWMYARRIFLEFGWNTDDLDKEINEAIAFFNFLNDHRKFHSATDKRYKEFLYHHELTEK